MSWLPKKEAPLEYLPRQLSTPRNLDEPPLPPARTVASVHDQLQSNRQSLNRTLELARDMVEVDRDLRAELLALIAADRERFEGALSALEDLEKRVAEVPVQPIVNTAERPCDAKL